MSAVEETKREMLTDYAKSSEDESPSQIRRRTSHIETLLKISRESLARFDVSVAEDEENVLGGEDAVGVEDDGELDVLPPSEREKKFHNLRKRLSVYQERVPERLVEVRIKNYSYFIPVKADAPTVKTVANQSICYAAYEFFRRIHQYRMYRKVLKASGQKDPKRRRSSRWSPVSASDVFLPFDKKRILSDINLVLKPGRTYVVLGPPASGKTTLLTAIAGRLPVSLSPIDGKPLKDRPHQEGRIEYNGVSATDDPSMVLPNVVSFVGQLDIHAPYLTVKETFDFAFQSRTGGKHENLGISSEHLAAELDEQRFTENLTIEGLDLSVCADTFVGNSDIRGVSGGQRRRVTVGEMMQGQSPVACADEISTGLDAAVTHDIVHSIVAFAKAAQTTRIVSLLQPGPETFCLFDEVILLAKGYIIFAGPITEVVDYFAALGYQQVSTIDVADFLQLIPTPDGAMLFDAKSSPVDEHYTAEGFAQAFRESEQFKRIKAELEVPSRYDWTKPKPGAKDGANGVPPEFKIKYQNTFFRTTKLNLSRHFTLWKRDKGYIIGKLFENIGMAVATGGILYGSGKITWEANSVIDAEYADNLNQLSAGVYGALFMTTFHILLGTMTSAPDEIDGRLIHYKHCDANFYQTFAFVFGRLLSTIPQRTIEIFAFGIPLYWMVGLDASAASFFTYIALLICYTTGVKMMFSILAQSLPKKASVQGIGTFIVLLLTLFGGFIVYPISIPGYYSWIYWANPMAWALQGLASTEFTSSKYDSFNNTFLTTRGFKTGREWIGYSFVYMIPFTLMCTVVLGVILKYVRIEPEKQHVKKKAVVSMGKVAETDAESQGQGFNLPFTPVDLTFQDLVYEVNASTSGEKLRLLNEVSGAFTAGRMCALMGSSGAGKTTLMDVIAMRKTSGTITGEIRLNGFLQERVSFLRCSGYVEQFDVQQAELTVRETVLYCARLRLDVNNPAIGDDAGKQRYVDHVLATMELTDIQTLQVGSYEEGGLTFEQRKRLAIACELAGSPSVIFLDEPTSGLDSRGALVVMRAMKRIAEGGRTVCATIHQPSSAVFEMFDDLILLKKGGNVVFFGELGPASTSLVEYFETRGAVPIEFGENPAAWMLRAYAGEQAGAMDYAELYKSSHQYSQLLLKIKMIEESRSEEKRIHYDCAFSTKFKERLQFTNRKITTIYKRSPAYNLTRLVIAVFYSFLIGSVFLRTRYAGSKTSLTESDMDGIFGTLFLSTIIIGVTSISMAVPVMKKIRDVFYKHRASGMLEHNSLSWALSVGEIPYILMVSLLFGFVYYFTVGLFKRARQFWYFYLFFTLNVANYAFFGQAFICLVSDIPTSGALVGALVGYNVFFSGYIVKPQYFTGPFQLGLWTAPGRFAYEGIITTQFHNASSYVLAEPYSPFFFNLNCTNETINSCFGTVEDYTKFSFGSKFSINNFWWDVGALIAYVILARLLTWYALKRFNYVNT